MNEAKHILDKSLNSRTEKVLNDSGSELSAAHLNLLGCISGLSESIAHLCDTDGDRNDIQGIADTIKAMAQTIAGNGVGAWQVGSFCFDQVVTDGLNECGDDDLVPLFPEEVQNAIDHDDLIGLACELPRMLTAKELVLAALELLLDADVDQYAEWGLVTREGSDNG